MNLKSKFCQLEYERVFSINERDNGLIKIGMWPHRKATTEESDKIFIDCFQKR